jgi:hypothetical protein
VLSDEERKCEFQYKQGDLLVKKENYDYWPDYLIVVETEKGIDSVYQLYTSDSNIERKTAHWVHLHYEKPCN